MALTFLNTVLDQQSFSSDGGFPVAAAASHVASTDQACLHNRDEFYAEIIRSLNECVGESCSCGDGAAAASLIEDESLARREWKRLLERVLSGPIEA
jgi:hypothetical protein